MKSLFTFIIFLFTVNFVASAQDARVYGRLTDEDDGRGLEFANIALLNPNDSSVISGGMTDENGEFSFNTAPGEYLLRLGFIGYEQRISAVTVEAGSDLELGTVTLSQGSTTLEEVTVEGVAQLFESDIDKRTFNVENSIVAEGGTAEDILETLPSVQVDEEGNISMRGSGNILIYVNGRPTNLSGDDTESILQQFPANSIKSVELITNPSSRYDAAGVGGIINIILKKDQRQGLNGSVNASVGTRNKYTGGVNLNYGTRKINLFANYSYQYRELFQISESIRENLNATGNRFIDQDFRTDSRNEAHLIRTGFDFNINDNNTLGFYAQSNYSDRGRTRLYNQRFLDINQNLNSLQLRDLNENQQRQNYEVGLTYDLELDTLGQKIYLTSSYAYDDADRVELYDELFFTGAETNNPEDRILQRYERPRESNLFIFQADYEKPFGDGVLELGAKSTLNRSFRSQEFGETQSPGFNTNPSDVNYIRNDTVSDTFAFDEDVHALYMIYRNKIGKFGYQAGLRGELSLTESRQGNLDSTFVNNYFNLFPSLYLNYDLGQEKEFQINYSRRISRPSIWNLASFYNVQDPLNLRIGNPYLQPEFTDSYEFSYLQGWEKIFVTGTLYYRQASDIITRVFSVLDDNSAIVTFGNANQRRETGFELINQINPNDWFDATLSTNLFYQEIIGDNLGEGLNNSNFTYTVSLLGNFRIPRIASLQLQGNYRGPIALPQGFIEPIYGINAGIKRDILNDNATISLNVSDIFNTRVFRISTEDANFTQDRYFNRETRIGTLTFTYRFGGFRERGSGGRNRDDDGDDDGDF